MTSPVVVAVTGANGYVGSLITGALSQEFTVVGLVRTQRKECDRAWSFDMSEDNMAAMLRRESVTHVVHAAWDMKANSLGELEQTCVAGTKRLLAAAERAAVKHVIFISTISAFEGARSAYGRSKLRAETVVASRNGLILRLGLVLGDSSDSFLGRLRRVIRSFRVIPVMGWDRDQYLLHERSLCAAIIRAVRGDFAGERRVITLANPQPIRFAKLLRALAASERRSVLLVPVPWRVIYLSLRVAESCGLRLSFRSDSVIGFIYQNPTPDFTSLIDRRIETAPFNPTML